MNSYLRTALTAFSTLPALAQTTDFNATFALGSKVATAGFQRSHTGAGSVGSLGGALVVLNLTQARLSQAYSPGAVPLNEGVGPLTVELTLSFNRLDRITLAFQGIQDPAFESATVDGRVSGGTGAYTGASTTGGMSLTLTRTAPIRYNVSLTDRKSVV